MFRLLRCWSLSKEPSSNSSLTEAFINPECVPGVIYDMIFCHLSGSDVKQCRLVCRHFDKIVSTYLDETTCIIFDGNGGFGRVGFSRHKAKKLIRYLTESELKFSLWSTMRLRNVTETQIKTLLQEEVKEFANTMQNVTTIELSKSSLTWTTLIRFLDVFKNLEHFIDENNKYLTLQDPIFSCCQAYFDPEERTLLQVFDYKLNTCKTLHFTFVEPTWDIILMMRVFELTCGNIEEFQLAISSEKETFPYERAEFSNNLGLFLLKSLSTLRSLSLKWSAINYHCFFEDFFNTIPVLLGSHKEILITELVLDFDWIFLGHASFEQDLVPFVRRLNRLKTFTLQKIILQAGLGHLIEEVRPPPSCEFNIGILLSDHPTVEEAAINREILKTNVFTSSATVIRVAVDLPETISVGHVLPLGLQSYVFTDDDEMSFNSNSSVVFPKVTELMIKHLWNGTGTSFASYNIHGLVASFPNLTELCIFDGPKFEYIGTFRIRRQWDYMSDAHIMDTDLQLIFTNLVKLKILRIRACLENVTDCGLTGMNDQKREIYYETLVCSSSGAGSKFFKEEILPCSVSNLKDLEEFILKGVGDGVTDITAYFAFSGLKKIHTLAICGTTKMSRAAKEYLKQSLIQNGCKTSRFEFT